MKRQLVFIGWIVLGMNLVFGQTVSPLMRTVDLDEGESARVELCDGTVAEIKLLELEEHRDILREAVREARVTVEINGERCELVSSLYRLPVTVAGVRVDCPVTSGYAVKSSKSNAWAIEKAARFRLWPAGSPLLKPGTFTYPIRQKWFASDTQMANEPCFVDAAETPGQTNIYYHYGTDFGGSEGLAEVLAATDGLVVSAAGTTLPEHIDSPVNERYDVVYVVDQRGWYYRYSHMSRIDVAAGDRVRMGEQIGLLGKEGGSGGWSHLHFDITSRQPSGEWGKQDPYPYVWEAYQTEYNPEIIAVARPHHLIPVGGTARLDGSRSWSASGEIPRYEWTFTDGTTAEGPSVVRQYDTAGVYSEILKVTDSAGRTAWDFAVVQVMDPEGGQAKMPPSIHANYYPTFGIRAGDEVTFKVRSFLTQHGDEVWDFGDGTPEVRVKSDGNAVVHAKDGYAQTVHRFSEPGDYIVRVERSNERGEKAIAHLIVHVEPVFDARTKVAIEDGNWTINGDVTSPGAPAEGLLMNVRMVNSTFEDRNRDDFDPTENTDRFLAALPEYASAGVRAITLNVQGGMPGYEGALNSGYQPDGALRFGYMERLRRVIEACDRNGVAVILGCFYQRQDQVLQDEEAVRRGLKNVVEWVGRCGFENVVIEIANEFEHGGFDHAIIKTPQGEIELLELIRDVAPHLLVSTSGLGHGQFGEQLAREVDYLLIHFNGTGLEDIPARIQALKKYGKPIVCNEDDKVGKDAAEAARLSVENGASYGMMLKDVNQFQPFEFKGIEDDRVAYGMYRRLTGRR
jgi:murein DD-endopeptidase MepM/ murein hydrolase activator NlpD